MSSLRNILCTCFFLRSRFPQSAATSIFVCDPDAIALPSRLAVITAPDPDFHVLSLQQVKRSLFPGPISQRTMEYLDSLMRVRVFVTDRNQRKRAMVQELIEDTTMEDKVGGVSRLRSSPHVVPSTLLKAATASVNITVQCQLCCFAVAYTIHPANTSQLHACG